MEKKIENVCIFCGSAPDVPQKYKDYAFSLGALLAGQGIHVITGGGSMGLMASVEEGVISSGGRVTGVIPSFMVDAGWLHMGLSSVTCTTDMQERKKKMFDMSDAIVALPGGVGTLDELTEVLTLKQLGMLSCPVVIANAFGFYDPFISQLERQIADRFVGGEYRELWAVASSPADVIALVENFPEWDPSKGKLSRRI